MISRRRLFSFMAGAAAAVPAAALGGPLQLREATPIPFFPYRIPARSIMHLTEWRLSAFDAASLQNFWRRYAPLAAKLQERSA